MTNLDLLRAAEAASSIICQSCGAAVALPQSDDCHDCTNERAQSALSLYRFLRFEEGLSTFHATRRVAEVNEITFADAGTLVGIGLGRRERTRN